MELPFHGRCNAADNVMIGGQKLIVSDAENVVPTS
jgi:hypothetical protein